jgi:hypothetical protein
METKPKKEHHWLQKFVGEWAFEGESVMAPDQPAVKFSGTESVRSIGGLWVVAEGRSEMPGGGGGEATTIMTLGYDPQRDRFAGTFIVSMMTHLWVYDGALDADGRVLTLDTEGPADPDGSGGGAGKLAKFKDVIELRSDDHRVLSSSMLGADGQWTQFMTAHYRRTR